jgi:diacylglycerol kinase family enzyme
MEGQIPALINRRSGTAAAAIEALKKVGGFDIREVEPTDLKKEAQAIVAHAPKRIVVSGGDGTIATVAHLVANTGIELAIVPGGTLNHLAKHLGLPEDLVEAAKVAREGITRALDAGQVNDTLFLNTSSVGAYETFVRHREAMEPRWGYAIASLIAGWRILVHTPVTVVRVEVGGAQRIYRTPLLFIGVGERELRMPTLGSRMDHGRRGLHLMIVRSRTGARLASLALQTAARGVKAVARTPAMDSLIVERCTIETRSPMISVDGELISASQPLEYEFVPGLLTVVVNERRQQSRDEGAHG